MRFRRIRLISWGCFAFTAIAILALSQPAGAQGQFQEFARKVGRYLRNDRAKVVYVSAFCARRGTPGYGNFPLGAELSERFARRLAAAIPRVKVVGVGHAMSVFGSKNPVESLDPFLACAFDNGGSPIVPTFPSDWWWGGDLPQIYAVRFHAGVVVLGELRKAEAGNNSLPLAVRAIDTGMGYTVADLHVEMRLDEETRRALSKQAQPAVAEEKRVYIYEPGVAPVARGPECIDCRALNQLSGLFSVMFWGSPYVAITVGTDGRLRDPAFFAWANIGVNPRSARFKAKLGKVKGILHRLKFRPARNNRGKPIATRTILLANQVN